MKKVSILLILLVVSLFSIIAISSAADEIDAPVPGPIQDMELDPETGLPSELSKFQESADKLSKEEARKEYLKQEWTKLAAGNKYTGPILFYTNKFFSFFNPLWKYTLGVEFSWSWAFFLALILWIVIIIIVYRPVRDILSYNPLISLLLGIIIASLGAHFGMSTALNMLSKIFVNWMFVTVFICLAIIATILYWTFSKKFAEQLEEERKKHKEQRREHKQKLKEKITDIELRGRGVH